jgi:endonuclease/exonuclease/phosphatase family metal-dependent hydrolase
MGGPNVKAPVFSERARRATGLLGTICGAGATLASAALWLAGPFLPLEPPLHAWLLYGATGLGVAGLASQALGARSLAATVLGALGLLLAAAFFGWFVGPVRTSGRGIEPAEIAAAPRRPREIRVLSYNVLHGYPRFAHQESRLAALGSVLARLEPDLVLLQEAWCTRRHGCLINRLAAERGALHGYHLAYAPVNGSLRLIGFEEGLAVASRWPIESVEVHALPPRERPWRHRAVLEVTVRIDGEAWTFATAHLADRDAAAREAQAGSLAAVLPPGGPLVIGADLNGPIDSPAGHALEKRGLEPVLAGARDHVQVRGLPTGWTVAEARWILTPEDLTSLTGRSEPISDHPAAWIELAHGRAGEAASPGEGVASPRP